MENISSETSSGKMSSSEKDRCAEICSECYNICLRTIKHCLEKGGEHAEASHINLLTDCACISATSSDFLVRGSENHIQTCRACSEICRLCAEECKNMTSDAEMEACAEVCERCAESCEQMSTH